MAGKLLNIMVCSPLKLHHGLTGKYYALCHYSYNLPLCAIWYVKETQLIEHSDIIFYTNTNINNQNEKSIYQILLSARDWCIAQ